MSAKREIRYGGDVGWMEVTRMTIRARMGALLKGLGQSVLSLSFNLGGILAGTLLASYVDVFSVTPWAFLVFPGILSIRGAIGGLFSGRLSTALHIGTVRPSYTKNTRLFYVLLSATATLTLGSGVTMGLAASLFSALSSRTTAADSLAMITVIIATMALSFVAISPITLGISILSFRRGLDPDVVVYPLISTVADVLVTLCYILVLDSFLSSQLGPILVWLVNIVFLLAVSHILIKNRREEEFAKTIREFLLTLVLVAFIVNITGLILGEISQAIGDRPEIYVVYPALIDTVGDVGSIVGSTATTNLALGTLRPTFSSIKQHLAVIGNGWIASAIMFLLFFTVASTTHGTAVLGGLSKFAAQILITNVISVSAIVIISYAVAINTYKRGWDPDNFVIPIESSLADSITSLALLVAVTTIF